MGVAENETALLRRIWGSVYVANPFRFRIRSGIRGKFRPGYRRKGVVKRMGPNRYVRNPFLSQFELRMRRAQWKN